MEARTPVTPAFPANAIVFPDIPSRSESRLISSGMEISAGKAGIHGQFGTLPRWLGRVVLRRHRLVLNLGIMLLELGVGGLRRKRLNIGETFRVVFNLGGQPGNIRRRMFVLTSISGSVGASWPVTPAVA